MSSAETIDVLNRVLAILSRSFPQYLRYARPYIPPGRENVMQMISQIATAQDAMAERITNTIFDAGGRPDDGDFPIEYTDTHDLGIDFLLQEAIDCQKQDVADLEQCVDALRLTPAAHALATDALNLANGQFKSLEQIKPPANGSAKQGLASSSPG